MPLKKINDKRKLQSLIQEHISEGQRARSDGQQMGFAIGETAQLVSLMFKPFNMNARCCDSTTSSLLLHRWVWSW
jgi:hypothetical protein